jgi:acyl-CoA thioester hydrolase
MAVHKMNIRVRFGELDPYNHVNHAVYISYFEAARVELLIAAGHSLGQMRSDGHSIVVSEINTKFLGMAEELDDLVVETEILEFRRVTSTWRQRIMRIDEVIATQELRAALITNEGKPVRFPEAMIESLRPWFADNTG